MSDTEITPEADLLAEASIEERELERGLSNRHLQLIALGGAIGTGMFMGSSRTINVAGPSSMLVYALIGFFLYFMMRAMGEMLLANLKYKSFRDIAEDMLGPAGGFIVGWTYWFSWIVAAMGDLAAITGYAQYWWPEVPLWLPSATLAVVLFLLNVLAVRFFGEAEFWFALIKLVAVGALIIVAAWLLASSFVSPEGNAAQISNLWNDGGFFPNGALGFLGGFQIAFFAFVGLEVVGTAAAETRNPERNLPRAINAIPVRLALFYVLALAAICAVIPWRSVVPGISPFVSMFGLAGFGAAASVMNFVLLTAAASSDNSGMYSTSRMMYGLALDGQAPKAFGKLSKRNVPQNALIVSLVMLMGGVAFLYTSDTIIEAFTLVTSIAAVLFIFTWSVIVVCYLVYRRKYPELHQKSIYKMPGGIVAAWAVIAFFVISTVILCFDAETRQAVFVTPIWFVVIGVAYFFHSRRLKNPGATQTTAVGEQQE
ncbi:amino acid permease [Propionimicrobium sp. PCR01-08-3]|uniref:amino acid permease n=1 Tax=Propionimicrobium sp. PCR01-08-3 TaxID=3052086 RepID=UPI00255CF19B|nr:amino acid permease [Propionimicrobium sp. PCR01-08-3]WIY82702.1 amino acid permease [Propionimicrobium sp. PCR01-08-3]